MYREKEWIAFTSSLIDKKINIVINFKTFTNKHSKNNLFK
jgi:hypothetical protein